MNKKNLFALTSAVLLVSACGGGASNADTSTPNLQTPIRKVGMQRQYVGTVTRDITYANPTNTSTNNTLAYNFSETFNVLQAPANAPAPLDVRSVYTYTVTQDPGTGTVPISRTLDTYENLISDGATQSISVIAQTSTDIANDESSNAIGGGPYTATTTTSTTFPTPRIGLSYPLQTGATITVPQSASQKITFTDINTSGIPPLSGNKIGYTRIGSENNDGSYSFQLTGATGITDTYVQNSDGSGYSTTSSPAGTTTTTVSTPVLNNGTYTIPIIRATAPSTISSNNNYQATDWYPGNTVVTSPLVSQTQTVVGPVSVLPAQCNGALIQANMIEVDAKLTTLYPINAQRSVSTTQSFISNGVAVCSLTQQTNYAYAILTGALVSTTSTQTVSLLKALN